jgi:hypothetical protein
MDVNSSAVLPPHRLDNLPRRRRPVDAQALDRLPLSVGLQAQLFSEPLVFLSYAICNSVNGSDIAVDEDAASRCQTTSKIHSEVGCRFLYVFIGPISSIS